MPSLDEWHKDGLFAKARANWQDVLGAERGKLEAVMMSHREGQDIVDWNDDGLLAVS